MRATHIIILNPTSGRGRGGTRRAALDTLLDEGGHGIGWEIRETESPGDATRLAREAALEGATTIAAAGGDGTLSEVLNGIMESGAASRLAVIPLGTGNDFSRHIGLGTNLPLSVETFLRGQDLVIDIGRVTFGDSSRYFLNICGTGFDALCAARVDGGRKHFFMKHVKGMPAYLLAVLAELRGLTPAHLTCNFDGQTSVDKAVLCAVANSSSYGGGMLVAPDAELEDGLFDICTIGDAGRMEFLKAFPGVFKGTHVTHPKVTMRRAASVRLDSDPSLPILVDGDVAGFTPAQFEILRRAITLEVPPSYTT